MCLHLRHIVGILFLSGVGASCSCSGTQVVNYRIPTTPIDQYENYTIELLTLVLEKTRASHGDYELQPLPKGVNRLRAKQAIASSEYPNLVIEDSYDGVERAAITFIEFPVDLGVLSYRVCFVNPGVAQAVAATKASEELKQYRILQGIEWADTKILHANGFKTLEVPAYKSSFRMVASGRADLFCLGASQIMNEYLHNNSGLHLTIDDSFYFYYKLPRFFFLSAQNKILKARIEQGLLAAHKDKSLQALWDKKFLTSLKFIQLSKRRMFLLNNPLNANLNSAYEYYFAPLPEIAKTIDVSVKK
ncbi:hypothetical protein [Cellvibrio sp. pealriver]|uniref:hypothetical protein n=1 Tax=Cellvibrio sp. pealriver TaxID=1622269 RepID=UPI000AD66763|nr:hypothetical protein [Cellvibrio sp. pealriver]